MKKRILKFFKWTFIVLGVLVVVLSIVVALRQNRKFDAPFPDIHASTDSAVIARGRYLAYGPAHCSGCHLPKEKQEALRRGEEPPLVGGFVFDIPPGKFYSKNITPDKETGIGNRTDAELARVLRHGVGHDGRSILPFMEFKNASDQDLTAMISFLRSQPPVKNKVPDHEVKFPIGHIVKAFFLSPQGPTEPIKKYVTEDTTIEYGKYLATCIANCKGCHTNRSLMTGEYTGPDFAGGLIMESGINPDTTLAPPNLTQDPTTGRIYGWTFETFSDRFKKGRVVNCSDMPWEQYQKMSQSDLKAIFKFLQSLPPVKNDTGPAVRKTS